MTGIDDHGFETAARILDANPRARAAAREQKAGTRREDGEKGSHHAHSIAQREIRATDFWLARGKNRLFFSRGKLKAPYLTYA
jgi:hypothetical protein